MSAEVLSFNYKNVCEACQHTCAQIKALRSESERSSMACKRVFGLLQKCVWFCLWLSMRICIFMAASHWLSINNVAIFLSVLSWESKDELSCGNLITCRSTLNNNGDLMMFFLFFMSKRLSLSATAKSQSIQPVRIQSVCCRNRCSKYDYSILFCVIYIQYISFMEPILIFLDLFFFINNGEHHWWFTSA